MNKEIKILLVEDEAVTQLEIRNILNKLNYKIIGPCNTGQDAIQCALSNDIDLILMDIRLIDNVSGIDAAYEITKHKDIPIVFMTAYSNVATLDKIIKTNPYGYLTKPLDHNTFILTIQLALQKYQESAKMRKIIEDQNSLFNDIVIAIANITEQRDPYTAGHQKHVSRLATRIAELMHLPKEQCRSIYYAGYVHDIGKISIPGEFLTTTKKLSKAEREILNSHVVNGYEILKNIKFPWPIADIVLQHHERLNGSGYPYGLKGNEILLEAQIIAVADVAEAMFMPRPYKERGLKEEVIMELDSNKNILYNEEAVKFAIPIINKIDNNFNFS